MQNPHLPPTHPPLTPAKIGVLVMNLGTPEATSYFAIRRYLKEFLSDSRVIELWKPLWWVILNGIILTTRPARKGKDYAKIWNNETNESPLKTFTRETQEKLQAHFPNLHVAYAMRYGFPAVEPTLQAMQKAGCEKILLLPLYPQYAASTTATACDHVFRALMKMRWQPTLRVAPPYFEHPAYIGAVAEHASEALAKLDFEPEVILSSFHGVPKTYLMKGDPYHCQAVKSGRLIREKMGLSAAKMRTTFQSRFGAQEWLQPYTDKTVEALAKEGVKRLAIVSPGFSADCIETLEELDMENREIFLHGGGEKFAYLPCLNSSERAIKLYAGLIENELKGWI